MFKRLLLVVLILTACDEDDDPIQPGPPPTITLSADTLPVTVGASVTVNATVINSTATPVFASRDSMIARVSTAGLISGVSAGNTWVVATLGSGLQVARDSVFVRVTQIVPGPGGQQPPPVLPLLGTGMVTERFTAEVAAAGNVAYTTTWGFRQVLGNAIKIWNVSGNTPILADSLIITGAGTVSDVQISDDGSLLVASVEGGGSVANGIVIFDRTNPLKPTQITRYIAPNTSSGVHTVKLSRINNRHYAFLNINSPARLSIVDITNPAAPVEVFTQLMGDPFIHDVFVRDGVLMAALWHTGMRIFDLGGAGRGGSPSAPVELGTVKTRHCRVCAPGSSSVHNVWWFHNPATGQKRYAFLGEEGPGSVGQQRSTGALHVVDVTNFDAPVEVAVYEPDSTTTSNEKNAGAHNFVMDEESGILYAAFYNGGVRAIDVRGDLSACTAAQKTPDGRCDLQKMGRIVGVAANSGPPKYVWGVAIVGNFLYASDMWNGIHKIDISGLKR